MVNREQTGNPHPRPLLQSIFQARAGKSFNRINFPLPKYRYDCSGKQIDVIRELSFTNPPMFTDYQIAQFQEIYRNLYHKEISKKEALDQAIKLISMVKLLSKPLSQKEYESLERKRTRMFLRHVRRAFEQYQKDQGTDQPEEL